MAIITKTLAQLDTRCRELSVQHITIKDSIHVTFRQLWEVLNVRETELICKLNQMTEAKLKGLAAQRALLMR